jgi:GNAT superfamily N-acetyltransferase
MSLIKKHIDYLKNILFKNKISQLLIETQYDEAGEYLNLILIKIKPSQQNKGYGEAVLDNIISYADKNNVRIKINLQGLNKKHNIEFYRKHNFVLIKNDMVYFPKPILIKTKY